MPRGFVSVELSYAPALPYSPPQKPPIDAAKRLIIPIAPSNRLIGLFSRFTVEMNAIALVEHETVQNRQVLKGFRGVCVDARSEGEDGLHTGVALGIGSDGVGEGFAACPLAQIATW